VEEIEEKLAERKRMLAGAEGDLNDLRARHAALAAEVESRIDLEETEEA
jgi:hypothetical protein